MRLVIDLQTCQSAAPAIARHHLAQAQAIVRLAGRHEVWLALNGQMGNTIEALRCAFDGLVPQERIVVFDLPSNAGAQTPWRLRACEQIREGALAALAPDLVFVPNIFDSGGCQPVASIGSLSNRSLTVVSLRDTSWLSAPAAPSAQHQRQQAALRNAALILVTSEAARSSTCAALGLRDEQVRHLGLAVQEGLTPSATDGDSSPSCLVIMDNARQIWAAFEALHTENLSTPAAEPTIRQQRPRLAYISPLPPEKSGIADYSAELVPELARFYDVDLIIDQDLVSDPWIKTNLPLRSVAWFETHVHEYDRMLYHFGNSPIHKHMFGLLERHPGIVVLHDFYLGNVLDYLDHTGYQPGAFQQALYHSHGFAAFADQQAIGAMASIWKYPCNKSLLDQARGIIVHSRYPQQLATQWYGSTSAKKWRALPLLRGKPATSERAAARRALGLAPSDFVVCAFGMMGPTKCNDALLDAWLASPLSQDPCCRLIFVGANDPGNYGRNLQRMLKAGISARPVEITGFVSHQDYCTYLAASDAAVQLHIQLRGETAAAILDCLLHGVPTIANAHGSSADLPDHVLCKLPGEFTQDALINALVALRNDVDLRASLTAHATDYIQAEHAPPHVGRLYYEAIEHFSGPSAGTALLEAIGHISLPHAPTETDLLDVAIAIDANQTSGGPRQLFVDISAMVQSDLKTGIQRVVRSVLKALFDDTPAGYRVEPVYSIGGGAPYRYARRYMASTLGIDGLRLDDAPIDARPNDIFLGLDLFTHGTRQNQHRLQQFRNRGVQIYFVIYDILPILRPEMFPPGVEACFKVWLTLVAGVADGLICISRAVADEVVHYLKAQPAPRRRPLGIGYFHLGADIDASIPSAGLPTAAEHILQQVNARPSILMVGTLEPRKGHAQALAAFDLLWAKGVAVNLVIVGKQGWMVDSLAERLRQHPAKGSRLFWLEGASDTMLLKLYGACQALLAASEGEGFGLPLIEAAQHGIAIIARQLPVFREVAGEHAYYFEGLTAQALADAVHEWLRLHSEGKVPGSGGMPWLTWAHSTHQLRQGILEQHWYRTLYDNITTSELEAATPPILTTVNTLGTEATCA